jgi:hypothetical protein
MIKLFNVKGLIQEEYTENVYDSILYFDREFFSSSFVIVNKMFVERGQIVSFELQEGE